MNIKKGAMFGLDARIALAIFGALSVISGAALYSAIQESKITLLVTDINEIAKAYEQYYLDTGVHIRTNVSSNNNEIRTVTEEILTSNLQGWKGPYFNYIDESVNETGYLTYGKLGVRSMHYFIMKEGVWGGSTSPGPTYKCNSGDLCQVWVVLHELEPYLVDGVEIFFDGVIDYNSGKVRVVTKDDDANGKYATLAVKFLEFKK